MKKYFALLLIVFISQIFLYPQEERKVLVEVFTNSHCPLCPPAHTTLDNYLAGPNGNKINYIFYHMVYPYPTDALYQHNPVDSDGRDDYYNPPASTPRGWIDGILQGSYSGWASTLDNLVTTESPLKINLSGTKSNGSFTVEAEVTRTGNITDDDLVIQFVVVENLNYAGNNGITYHKNVMRDMIDGATGVPFSVNMNETKTEERGVTINTAWVPDSLKVIVFIQSSANKTVYQSAQISYSEFAAATGVGSVSNQPKEFKLEQNYPNPFNPSTTIKYNIPEENFVTLKVYNLLGKEVATLVNKKQSAGSYQYNFNAGELSSGIYFYKLTGINSSGKEFVQTKKMTLIK